jgi:hypothetical protein
MRVGNSLVGFLMIVALAACGQGTVPGAQGSSAGQDAQIAKLQADAELAKAQAAKAQAEAEQAKAEAAKAQAETAKLEDEQSIRDIQKEAVQLQATNDAEAQIEYQRMLEVARNGEAK